MRCTATLDRHLRFEDAPGKRKILEIIIMSMTNISVRGIDNSYGNLSLGAMALSHNQGLSGSLRL